MSLARPHLPTIDPRTSYSFYPYPLTGISSTSSTLRNLAEPPTSSSHPGAVSGPSRPRSRDRSADTRYAEKVRKRAEKRAVVGMRPAGFAVGRESESLDQEEISLEDERVSLSPGPKLNASRRNTHGSIDTHKFVRSSIPAPHWTESDANGDGIRTGEYQYQYLLQS